MRTLQDHKVGAATDALTITAVDKPGPGGAHHEYWVQSLIGHSPDVTDTYGKVDTLIKFQNGPIAEVGVNGVTHEALLAIVMDRLRSFQEGPYRCKANACALTHIEEAMHWLQQRTLERMRRGVEGTSTV